VKGHLSLRDHIISLQKCLGACGQYPVFISPGTGNDRNPQSFRKNSLPLVGVIIEEDGENKKVCLLVTDTHKDRAQGAPAKSNQLSFAQLFDRFFNLDKDVDDFATVLSRESENEEYFFRHDTPIRSLDTSIDTENEIFYIVFSTASNEEN